MIRKKTTTGFADLVTAANQIASKMGVTFDANCELVTRLGCESFGFDGLTVEEIRDLLAWDWVATGDPEMSRQMLVRGEQEVIARLKDNGATEAERTLFDALCGVCASVKPPSAK